MNVRAAVCPRHGPPEVVRVEERAVAAAGPGQIGVRVAVAAVNFPDVLLVAGSYQVSMPTPFVPGSEFGGIVDEIGPQTSGFAIGDRVTGTGMFGAFAERVVVDAASLALIPQEVDLQAAAAFGVAHRTAYHTLRSAARLSAGDELVVLGAGGGVGLAAVQLGVALGAHVTAVASSPEKLEAAGHYGAARLINYTTDHLRSALRSALPDGADIVIDPVGGDLSEPALRSLGRGGRFVTVGFASGTIPRIPLNLLLIKGVQVLGFQFQDVPPDEFTRNEQELHELLTTGRVKPHVGAIFSLDNTAAALRHVADGRAIGKVLIDLS
ncbi:NADPH:quinone oxidoreductase family protein [Mycolicibacterium iranicum]|uniref:NADPH:quinone oxidoreductase family protein n=1 Tax=Mycolicibacterium iranicum TaxID=912594 RepID=A0ABT4HHU8_MYCIR|nr:NADPH:quinone oxidoreductase family protein [Mycolicibacterium iranicum]MCZ0729762.1 NADPH:quinone oxidoreductase family protein [Mycolicibacterium iranicum]